MLLVAPLIFSLLQITKDSTELLSLLHVKSAGCFLFIKKVRTTKLLLVWFFALYSDLKIYNSVRTYRATLLTSDTGTFAILVRLFRVVL
jgi:hypothetical protein